MSKGHKPILNECHGPAGADPYPAGPGAQWRALNARWNEAGEDPLAAALKRSGIRRRFPIAVGTRSGAFPDFGSGCAGVRR
jgi:hypothetical protein